MAASQVSDKQAEQIRLHVFERLSFVEIAREELPGADEAYVIKRANSIGRSVKRALKKLQEFIEQECPDLAPVGAYECPAHTKASTNRRSSDSEGENDGQTSSQGHVD